MIDFLLTYGSRQSLSQSVNAMLFASMDLLFVSTMFSIAPLAWTDECCLTFALAVLFSCLNHPEYQHLPELCVAMVQETKGISSWGTLLLHGSNNQVPAGT